MEVLQRTANRGSISTGYDIDNSLKLEPDNVEFLTITNTSAGNRKTATYSFWLKRTELDASGYMQVAGLITTSETVRFLLYQDHIILENGNGGTQKRLITNAVYRDTSAWYHFVVAIDTTQSTAANRVKLYVNGVQETSFSTEQYPDQNFDLTIGQYGVNFPWRYGAYDATYFKTAGYLAEAHYIDGTQYAASDFGEYDEDSGIWKPKEFIGTYGTQGSYLNFSDSSDLGANPKGSDINAVLNNITSADQATDTPTNNFATLNPLWVWTYGMGISDGATKVANIVTAWGGAKGSIGVTNGKWYWEHSSFSGSDTFFGIQNSSGTATQAYQQAYTVGLFMNATSDIYFYDPSGRTESFSFTFAVSDVWGIALDLDGNTISFYRNGSIVNSAVALDGIVGNGELFPFVSHYGGGLNSRINLGGYTGSTISSPATDENGYGTFEYAPPSGYYALCTKNLAEYG
jgi:hypothetical protein